MKNFTAVEEQAEIERLARMICQAINGDLISPDTLIVRGEPPRYLDGYAVDLHNAAPAWVRYQTAAKMVFDYQRRREELHMLEFTEQDAVG